MPWASLTSADITPALFIGEAEGTMQVTIPLDDHVLDPRFYEPLTAYTLNAAGLTA
jgi:hypothetical protein